MKWLNGWHLQGDTVLVGTEDCCAGCGGDRALACVAISGNEPKVVPDWPFPEDKCPLCKLRKELRKTWESSPMTPRASELFKQVRVLEATIRVLEAELNKK